MEHVRIKTLSKKLALKGKNGKTKVFESKGKYTNTLGEQDVEMYTDVIYEGTVPAYLEPYIIEVSMPKDVYNLIKANHAKTMVMSRYPRAQVSNTAIENNED